MNSTPTGNPTADPSRNSDVENGRKNPVTRSGIPSAEAPSISAGSDASEDRDDTAIPWAGATARANRRSGTPRSHASGYIAAIAISVKTAVVATYIATAPSAVVPSRSASGTARANTPYGAGDRVPRTAISVTALIASAARTRRSRVSVGSRVVATAKISVSTMIGSMA